MKHQPVPKPAHIVPFILVIGALIGCVVLDTSLGGNQSGDQSTPLTTYQPSYQPSADIAQLANQAAMTDAAKAIFYAAQPAIDSDRATFDQHCQAPISNNTVELGCYTSDNRIYIWRITQPQLTEEMAVTAAHEMLHAAYAQLSDADRASLDAELEAETQQLHNKDLAAELRDYQVTEPGQRDNELHSLLGTEYSPLSPDLEKYYRRYFTNRAVVVGDAEQFNQVFTQLKATMSDLLTQIGQLRQEMAVYRRRRQISQYNALVPQVNALVKQYNQDVAEYNSLSRSLIGEEPTAEPP